mgnify:CR=1 FL=1
MSSLYVDTTVWQKSFYLQGHIQYVRHLHHKNRIK